jgi:3-hydroxyacyl-CoA dehydrogenase
MTATLTAAPATNGQSATAIRRNRPIRKVAVLGAGIMGSRIALHFANVGAEVLLLDMVPRELTDTEKAKNLTLEHPAVRNRVVNELFQAAVKGKPASAYDESFLQRVQLGALPTRIGLSKWW